MAGVLPRVRWLAGVRGYASRPAPRPRGMQRQTRSGQAAASAQQRSNRLVLETLRNVEQAAQSAGTLQPGGYAGASRGARELIAPWDGDGCAEQRHAIARTINLTQPALSCPTPQQSPDLSSGKAQARLRRAVAKLDTQALKDNPAWRTAPRSWRPSETQTAMAGRRTAGDQIMLAPQRRGPPSTQAPYPWSNLARMQIPDFLHLTTMDIERHAASLKGAFSKGMLCPARARPQPSPTTNLSPPPSPPLPSTESCTPFEAPEQAEVFRFETRYLVGVVDPRKGYPRARKVTVRFRVRDLGLGDRASTTLAALAAQRFDAKTGEVYMACDRFPTTAQNKAHLRKMIADLVAEARNPDTQELACRS